TKLGVPREWVARATDPGRAWVVIPGAYLPGDAAAVTRMRGVYAEPGIERVYTQREAMRRLVGVVDARGVAVDGLELTLDSLLKGEERVTRLARDSHGARIDAPDDDAPEAGADVVLTINQSLQEISERALADALVGTKADGGDIVIIDPHDGEIRAMASRRTDPRSAGSPAVSEPFEPGSTLKPLLASRLLQLQRARPDEIVNTENGTFVLDGRTITDEHKKPAMTLEDVIRYSSNIGIVKFTSRFSPREKYDALRDFGFGMPTGVPYPAEAGGTLRLPKEWSRLSPASLAMGYEIAVTPLQLAAAYVPIANGGLLLEPALIREIRTPDGKVRYHHEPRVIRRVMDENVAAEVRQMLEGVVTGGTSTEAAMLNFDVGGKSGTSRRTVGKHGYGAGAYTASFVELFPLKAPQFVVLVKLNNPKGDIFGGKTAAPVSKIVMQAALAASNASLDRGKLTMRDARDSLAPLTDSTAHSPAGADDDTLPPVVLAVGAARRPPAPLTIPRAIPDVHGLSAREAAYALHRAGFRVQLDGLGSAKAMVPDAGTLAAPGTLVRVSAAP
ncbi:MAG TPA: penicillin-binding transpeptidase domain-containing protein, partial [Gemmatimonadaceae bacterium]|nr:penicillin-binding transpeptidase domain-containing protein [Gemmatimonadaceae bacterium]